MDEHAHPSNAGGDPIGPVDLPVTRWASDGHPPARLLLATEIRMVAHVDPTGRAIPMVLMTFHSTSPEAYHLDTFMATPTGIVALCDDIVDAISPR